MELIAEIGSNFETFSDCQAAVIEAALAGATAVKFQMFSHFELYGFGSKERKFDPEWLEPLSQLAHHKNLKFGCTAFSQEGVDIVSPYVDFYKIASAENRMVLNFPRDIPKVVSTGGLEFEGIVEMIKEQKLKKDDCVMYCVSAYPAKYEDYSLANLFLIQYKLRESGIKLGLSDHTSNTRLAKEASFVTDIRYIEKHFRPMAASHNSPDYPHSIGRDEFKGMADTIKKILNGSSLYFVPTIEDEFRENHSRRMIEIDGVQKFVRPK